ncbi:sensor histidine kinase [Tahibacter soli]|uniref:Sensor histidine kinase n=1 Tax=Tahibacter soli TaxID=2983605 RepID=A0A9X3YQV5_9GAMM|nr:sensor histidine kinase [Tahibacter soli]MDC8015323.1 sensor histidine kinase [Tahibacter soli]
MTPGTHPRLFAWRARLVPDDLGLGWMPFWTLGYLCFLAMPLFVPGLGRPGWLWPTLLAAVVFLPVYFRSYRASGRELVLLLVAMWTLAVLLAPYNLLANTFVVYACGTAPWLGSLRRGAIVAAVLVLGYGLYALDRGGGAIAAAITLFVGAASFASNWLVRENLRKQTALRLSHDEVRRLAATAERERIGRDLHDLLGHTLSLIAIKTELATRVWDRDGGAARREVEEVERIARDALAQVRRAVSGIRAAGVAAELASARLLLESSAIVFRYDADLAGLPPNIETTIALAVREAVTNIQRHARASRASVSVRREAGELVVVVADDGRGGDIVPGNGLAGMRERLVGIGAMLAIDSVRGRGTTLTIRVPLPGDGAPGTATEVAK